MKTQLLLALTLALLLLMGVPSMAQDPFSVLCEPGAAPGTWVYTINNNSLTPNSISWLDLYWDELSWPDDWSITETPPNWTPSLIYLDWPSWDCEAIPGVPGPGNSLSGFSIESPVPALIFNIGYFVLDEECFQDGDVELVPEPATLLALGGMAGFTLIRRRRG